MHSFRVCYVQWLAETSFEFDHSSIYPIESLAVIRFSCSVKFKNMYNLTTTTSVARLQNAAAFV